MSEPASQVAIVITSYRQARFLRDALHSVSSQSVPPDEIVVVDGGSDDHPLAAVAEFDRIGFIDAGNIGLAGLRNVGLGAIASRYVIFLDADDVLYPDAVAEGIRHFASHPDAGFVFGASDWTDADLVRIAGPYVNLPRGEVLQELLRRNLVGMHGTVMYDAERLRAVGEFDERTALCEDYDLYLRMAKRFPVVAHAALVAGYRQHGQNLSRDRLAMLEWVLRVHARHRPPARDRAALAAWRQGRRHWRRTYGSDLSAVHDDAGKWNAQRAWRLLRIAPFEIVRSIVRDMVRAVRPDISRN